MESDVVETVEVQATPERSATDLLAELQLWKSACLHPNRPHDGSKMVTKIRKMPEADRLIIAGSLTRVIDLARLLIRDGL